MEYIRKVYGVPAKRSGRIKFTDGSGSEWTGVITGSRGPYLRAIMDEKLPFRRQRVILHPTWRIEYETPNGPHEGRPD